MADVADEPGLLMFLSRTEEVSTAVFDILCLTQCKLGLVDQMRAELMVSEHQKRR